jgi:pre-rRNA-processing protein TSR4
MSLLLQLNGAVPESPHERMFYIFGCKEKTCRRKTGSVRALRGVKVAKDFEEKEANARAARDKEAKAVAEERRRKEGEVKPKAGDLLFGSGAGLGKAQAGGNPFSSGGGSANPSSAGNTSSSSTTAKGTEQLRKSFADTLKISLPAKSVSEEDESLLYGPSEPWPSPLPHKYPLFYLDADYETLAAPEPQQNVETDAMEADPTPTSDSSADDGKLDTAFQKFADRVAQNPEQVLRYERAGTPLLYSHDDTVAKVLLDRKDYTAKRIPACSGCKKRERVFEFQLMPHTITVLEGEEVGLEGMEWGTIVVGSCLCVPKVRDENGVGWMEEWVGVQWEAQK